MLSASPNVITQVKDVEKDGYTAIQLGFEEGKNLSKPVSGHVKQANVSPKVIREFRVSEISEDMKIGESISADSFVLEMLLA